MTMSSMCTQIWSGKFGLREYMPIRALTFDVDCHVVKFLALKGPFIFYGVGGAGGIW